MSAKPKSSKERLKMDALRLQDIPGMTVNEHLLLSLGVMACCYEYVPSELKKAIFEACVAAKKMGANIHPQNLGVMVPLTHDLSGN